MGNREKAKNSDIYYLSLGKNPHIEMEGNKAFSLNGKFSIVEYSEEEIKIKASGMVISILGDGLNITFATDTNIFVIGKIISIEFN